MGRTVSSLGTSIYLQNYSFYFEMQTVLATWYGPSSFVGGGHPSWPLEVTGNSDFFKLVDCGNFVVVISSNTYALCTGGNTVLSIFRMEWT